MIKPAFGILEYTGTDQLRGIAQLISTFVFDY